MPGRSSLKQMPQLEQTPLVSRTSDELHTDRHAIGIEAARNGKRGYAQKVDPARPMSEAADQLGLDAGKRLVGRIDRWHWKADRRDHQGVRARQCVPQKA